MLGAGGPAKKTYVDDVFSTQVYTGNSSARSINNGIDLSGKGGLVWSKRRNGNYYGPIIDTVRGKIKIINPADDGAQGDYANTAGNEGITSFNSNGYSLGADGSSQVLNHNNNTYVSWTFRKAKGFFDIVTYTGNGSNRTIAHSLGSVPGMIMIKNTSSSENWITYHRTLKATHHVRLNQTNASASSMTMFNDTEPTASVFSVGTNSGVNTNGDNYVAYVFAGGESTAATARSVDFDGTGDKLNIASHADLQIGSSTYTMEFWVYKNADSPDDYNVWASKGSNGNNTREFALCSMSDQTMLWLFTASGNGNAWLSVSNISAGKIPTGQWVHICAQKDSSGYFSFFVNGTRTYYNTSGGQTLNTGSDPFNIGGLYDENATYESDIKVSNFRFVKGTALHTSSFTPPTAPLTNITNTKLLCCNDSSITGSTVTPSTISSGGSPTASTDSPFDDSAGFQFGENEDQNVIKCGSVTLQSGETNIAAYLGFEPQWLLFKESDGTDDWDIYDTMRGWKWNEPGDGAVSVAKALEPNTTDAEALRYQATSVTSTGFHLDGVGSGTKTFIYCAIRRPDGYVGKPPELGTDVFAIDTGNSSASIPAMDSNFPVDWAIVKKPAETHNNWAYGRLMENTYMMVNDNVAEAYSSAGVFDSNKGFYAGSIYDSDYQSWMWKRHAGFDMVNYIGDGTAGHQIPHSLSKTPEMMWVKRRDGGSDWMVYHKNLNGGTTPHNWFLKLNALIAESENSNRFGGAPSSTHFTVGTDGDTNGDTNKYIAMLWASVDGICKVGSFTGSSSDVTITTGFQPRFVIIKSMGQAYPWMVLDSVRGWGSSNDSGDDPYLRLNQTDAQVNYDNGYRTSTGFVVDAGSAFVNNGSGSSYIYYAHA